MKLKTGLPYWLLKDGLPYNYPQLNNAVSTDVLIIGGGISGALVGYYLTNANVECMVADARTIGLGSTCASTSLLQYEIDTPLSDLVNMVGYQAAVRAYKLCSEAIYKLESIAKNVQFKDFSLKKSLYFAGAQKDVALLKREFRCRKENGFDVDYLGQSEISKCYGFKSAGAILSALGAQTDAYLFTHYLLQYGLKKGMEVYDRTPITKIRHRKRDVIAITEQGFEVRAKRLIYAVGYEGVKYLDRKIVHLRSTYVTISDRMADMGTFPSDCMMWNTADPYLYMRSAGDHRIIVGGRDEQFYNVRRMERLIGKKSKQLAKDFNRLFQERKLIPEYNWGGAFGTTRDGLPFIGAYKKFLHSYFALGFGGNGITFSVIAAEIIRDQILGYSNADVNIFSFDRA
jgi:glycine/D-amino acid oxidase-like deaminating enzyme